MESLSVRYRPHTFDDVCGQDSVKKILKKQISTGNISNCMLFCGASGCGKTTLARIVANEINKGIGIPIEIDAASNNGVDNVRELVANAKLRAVDSEYKVFILDEVHALTNQAWQAFLKCIEEPPMYTIFIFCTTDPQKIPSTILNRVMRFNITRIGNNTIKERLINICKNECFINYEDSCDFISKNCNGQMRDGISMLELVSNYSTDLSINNLYEALGYVNKEIIFDFLNSIIDGNEQNMLMILEDINNRTSNITYFINQFLSFIFDVQKYILFGDINMTSFSQSDENKLNFISKFDDSKNYYNFLINSIINMKSMIKSCDDIYKLVQLLFLKMCRCEQ